MGALPLSPKIECRKAIEQCAKHGYSQLQQVATYDETSPYFLGLGSLPLTESWATDALTKIEGALKHVSESLLKLNDLVFLGLRMDSAARKAATEVGPPELTVAVEWPSEGVMDLYSALVSYGMGSAFGRWRCVKETPTTRWDPLGDTPVRSVLLETDPQRGTPILVDDRGTANDVANCVEGELRAVTMAQSDVLVRQVEQKLSQKNSDLGEWLRRSFFTAHIKRYSRSRRKAPIYWQLSTPSASYTVWCYYHRLTRDTFFRVANDYVTPKVDYEERKLNTLRQEAGPDPSSKQRKAIDAQETFVVELRAFLAEVRLIIPLWNPNLNDGVNINFAPLWRLVPQSKAWQKECKKVWDSLVDGDYDWAHLAMHLWPERVVPQCANDRSLAIAHGLEDVFWVEGDDRKWTARSEPTRPVDELVKERTSSTVKAALTSFLEAAAPGGSGRGRRKSRRSASAKGNP